MLRKETKIMEENNNQNANDTNEVGLPQTHTVILQKLLSQLPQLNITEKDRPKLAEAIAAAIEALRTTSGGVGLSQDAATDALLRMIEGRPSAQQEKNDAAVLALAALVDNHQDQDQDHGDAVNFLARMVKD